MTPPIESVAERQQLGRSIPFMSRRWVARKSRTGWSWIRHRQIARSDTRLMNHVGGEHVLQIYIYYQQCRGIQGAS